MNTEHSSVKISYKSAEIQPPLFIAGSFSNPPWTPQEMEHSETASGEQMFTTTIKGSPGSTVQYKFRVGTSDWWILNESAPTATDSMGNQNNIVKLTDEKGAHVERPPTPPPDSPPPRIISWDSVEIGPRLSHENIENIDDSRGPAPMFAYEFAGDNDKASSEKALSHVSSYASDEPEAEVIDANDPTLERFPSNREEIIEKVRTIETGLNEDRPSFDGVPLSPVVGPGRRHSAEPAADMLSVSLTPGDSGTGRSEVRLEPQRVSRSRDSLRPSVSGGSLHCIVEESAVEESAVEEDEQDQDLPDSAEETAAVPELDTDVSADTESDDPGDTAIVAEESEPARSLEEQQSEQEESTPDATEVAEASSQSSGLATNEAQVSYLSSTGVIASQNVNWFTYFFQLLFVDWMGAFFGKVFSRRRA